MSSRAEVTAKFAKAYVKASKSDKGQILDQVVEVTGWSRDNARRRLTAADQGDLDTAAYAGFLGFLAEIYEPIAWAEELIEDARAVAHPRLAFLYVIASLCWAVGRIEAAVGYCDAGQTVVGNDCDEVPFGIHGWLGSAYGFTSEPERCVDWDRAELARGRDTLAATRAGLVVALAVVMGCPDEAMAAASGLLDAAEATGNPCALSFALQAYGFAFRDADPDRARDALRRGLVIAQDSGNRTNATHLAALLARLEAHNSDLLAALDHFTVAIRNYHDSGDTTTIRVPLAGLAACLDRLGWYVSAATIAGFASNPLVAAWTPEINTSVAHLREVLGDQTYESLARKGETMTIAAMVTYAYDQIDQARAELNTVSK